MADLVNDKTLDNLTELLSNTVNMTSVFYDIFLNPQPMDVALQQYDTQGNIITISIPNRAKDRQIALSGEGSPEGVVSANIGASYVDETNLAVYFKATGDGTNVGWVIVSDQSSINTFMRKYLESNGYVTKDDIGRFLESDLNNALQQIDTARVDAIKGVDTKGVNTIAEVEDEGDTQVQRVTTAGAEQVSLATAQADRAKSEADNAEYWITKLYPDTLNLSKMYMTDKVFQDEQGFEQLKQMKRSTFDLSKFTVIGSPTITDDGVMSGATSSGIKAILSITNGQKVQYKLKYTHKQNSNLQFLLATLDNSDNTKNLFLITNSANSLDIAYSGTDHWVSNFNFTENQTYNIELDTDYNTYVKLYIDGVEKYNVSNLSLNYGANGFISIGNNTVFANNRNIVGKLDLKQFSITVDGKEVFSGNKTGIDTIKSDNYKVVGSPTITEDGVASGFSTSNYLTKSNVVTIGSSGEFHIDFEFDYVSHTDNQYILDLYNTISDEIILRREGNSYRAIAFANGTAIFNQSIGVQTGALHIKGFFEYKNSVYTLDINGVEKQLSSTTKMNALTYNLALGARIASGSVAQPLTNGSIDLNSFKIYADGNLVYQPCLKIPYTLSQTGSKIVDVAYRDRVIDLYEQEGKAGYYTIDEPNKNFTLPMGEIYGMIEDKADKINVEEQLATKTDMLQASGAGMPSNKYIDLTLGASGSNYTAPANGWVSIRIGNQVLISNLTLDGMETWSTSGGASLFLPVRKNDVFKVDYMAGTLHHFRFYYAQGSKEE